MAISAYQMLIKAKHKRGRALKANIVLFFDRCFLSACLVYRGRNLRIRPIRPIPRQMFFIGMKRNKQYQYAQGISSKDVCSNWQNSQITAMIVLSLILHRKCAKKKLRTVFVIPSVLGGVPLSVSEKVSDILIFESLCPPESVGDGTFMNDMI